MLTDPSANDATDPASPHSQLARLYARWRQPLLRLLRGRLRNPALAEDATQDVFVRLASARKCLSADEEQPYLRTVASSVVLDAWRRQGRGQGPVLVALDAPAEHGLALSGHSPACPCETAAQRQRLARLEQAVAELPERQRQAFLLNRIDGMTHDEVAAAMGISSRMVAKHLQRAMAYCALRVRYARVDQMEQLRVHRDDDTDGEAAP